MYKSPIGGPRPEAFLQQHNFDISNPEQVYGKIVNVFKEASQKDSKYYDSHGFEFENGEVHLVENTPDYYVLTIVEFLTNIALKAPSLSVADKYNLAMNVYTIFKVQDHFHVLFPDNQGYRPVQEPVVPLTVSGSDTKVDAPVSLLFKSKILTFLLSEDEGERDELVISCPRGITPELYATCLPFLGENPPAKCPDFRTWIAILAIAHYLDCDEKIMERIELTYGYINPNQVSILLAWRDEFSPDIVDPILSKSINELISCELINGSTVEAIHEKLNQIPRFQENVENISLELNLSFVAFHVLKNEHLEQIAAIFPKIVNLNIADGCSITKIPETMLVNLHSLDITNVKLEDYSVLNNRKFLEHLDVSNTPISEAPTGCPALKSLILLGCYNIKTIPKETLSKIQYLDIGACKLDDFTILNNLPSLESLLMFGGGHHSPAAVPTGCPNLKRLDISSCKNIIAIPTEVLAKLTYLRIWGMGHLIIDRKLCPNAVVYNN